MTYRFLAVLCSLSLLCSSVTSAQTTMAEAGKPPMLLGACTRDSLQMEPYAEWFEKYYGEYEPNVDVVARVAGVNLQDLKIAVFFGSWCGDSKREVPRFLKLLDAISFPGENLSLIAVNSADSLMKQSPGGEERGLDIYRVPTFVIYENGTETNRIVEYPVVSLERDLHQILSHEKYIANYYSFPFVTKWLDDGLLGDENVSHRGLANQIRKYVSSEGELSSVASVLIGREQLAEAVKLYKMNVVLFPKSANRYLALARGLHRIGEDDDARWMLERALELNDDPKRLKSILELLDQVMEI